MTDSGPTDIGRDFGSEPPEPESKRVEDPRRARTGPSSAPVDELDASATAVARVPLPEPLVVTPKRVRQPFDTHRFVSKLNAASIEPDVSKSLMESVRGLITQRIDRAAENMLSKEELDNVSRNASCSDSSKRTCSRRRCPSSAPSGTCATATRGLQGGMRSVRSGETSIQWNSR